VTSCSLFNRIDNTNYHILKSPPNGIKINEALYCDQTEISNIYWLEYLYWLRQVFGKDSQEYRSAFPDTTVWTQESNCLAILSEYYLRHPAYSFYPVVGISQKQALDYSKWRSDRVFEALLIDNDVIDYNPEQNADMYFTIETYFDGKYNDITPDPKFLYYPEFRLPTLTEYQDILSFADSTNSKQLDRCWTKKCKECRTNYPDFHIDIEPCPSDTFEIDPTRLVGTVCLKNQIIPNLIGNVSEWISEENACVGGSWIDEKEPKYPGIPTKQTGA
jgi:hypothetical protein